MNRINNLVRQNILSLRAYSSARSEYAAREGTFLDANENPFGSTTRYPDPNQAALKKKISDIKGVPVENIVLGNGSDEIIDLCFRIFCEPGIDKALTFVPTYGMYEVAAQINNTELIKVPLNSDFQLNQDMLTEQLADKNLKIVIVCSPNNPTGNYINDLDLVLQNFNGIVIVDEAYIDFCKKTSLSAKILEYENLIVLQTLSKAWALASARIGIAFSNTETVKIFNKVKPPYNISTPNQELALRMLDDQKLFRKRVNCIVREREYLKSELKKLPYVKAIFPSDANFILIQVKDADKLYRILLSNQIIVRNRSHEIENCLRVTIGTPQENLKLIKILNQIDL